MRALAVAIAGVVLLLAGCGGGGRSAAPPARSAHLVCEPSRVPSYTVCGYPLQQRVPSTIWASFGRGSVRLTGPAERVAHDPHPAGFWVRERLFLSRDSKTLLAQWSGLCESQSSYLVSAVSGSARPIFRGHVSYALGWSKDGRARVRLVEPVYAGRTQKLRAGVYRVDPATLAASLERPGAKGNGC